MKRLSTVIKPSEMPLIQTSIGQPSLLRSHRMLGISPCIFLLLCLTISPVQVTASPIPAAAAGPQLDIIPLCDLIGISSCLPQNEAILSACQVSGDAACICNQLPSLKACVAKCPLEALSFYSEMETLCTTRSQPALNIPGIGNIPGVGGVASIPGVGAISVPSIGGMGGGGQIPTLTGMGTGGVLTVSASATMAAPATQPITSLSPAQLSAIQVYASSAGIPVALVTSAILNGHVPASFMPMLASLTASAAVPTIGAGVIPPSSDPGMAGGGNAGVPVMPTTSSPPSFNAASSIARSQGVLWLLGAGASTVAIFNLLM
ncbi:hypothetical protein HDU76_007728 [Blyttiomyces sp. JEL0837]|nr:hypothetical protein HDU76_007728 [Blyttiomyces sp. JEL0837]